MMKLKQMKLRGKLPTNNVSPPQALLAGFTEFVTSFSRPSLTLQPLTL